MDELHVCIYIKIDTNGDMLSRSEGHLLAAITLFAGRQRLTTITAEVFTSILADFPAVFFHICHGTQQAAVVTPYRAYQNV